MPVKYQRVWDTMNSLEMIISKVVSAREMIDVANEALEYNQKERAEKMTMAAYEFLGYFIEEFDEKFRDAWQATVGDLREGDVKEDPCMTPWGHSDLEYASKHSSCDKDDKSPECQKAWNDFWEQNYYPEEHNKVKKWVLPVEVDDPSGVYYVSFPEDLLKAVNFVEGDEVCWVDNNDGTYTIRKVTNPIKVG